MPATMSTPVGEALQQGPRRAKDATIIMNEVAADELKITISIWLDPRDEGDNALIEDYGESITTSYQVRDAALDANCEQLWKAFADAYQGDIGKLMRDEYALKPLEDDQLRQFLTPLARQGEAVFNQLFGCLERKDTKGNYRHELSGFPDKESEPIRRAVLRCLRRHTPDTNPKVPGSPARIFISSESPLFPWSLLYVEDFNPVDTKNTVKPEGFWGFRAEIQQEVQGTSGALKLPAAPAMLAAICPKLDEDGELHRAGDDPFADIEQFKIIGSSVDLANALSRLDANCFYFYGHAHHDMHPTRSTSWLALHPMQTMVSDLAEAGVPGFDESLKSPVVAFLNGCGTGRLSSWDTNTVAGYLTLNSENRLCLITAIADVPVVFGREFARIFWRHFLRDRLHLGAALLQARKDMLDTYHNPLGLLYQFFGRADVYVPRAKTTRKDA